jgi:5-methylcytosine-specific restriction enzyme subunit McrC
MTTPIVLREYERATVPLDDDAARALTRAAAERIRVGTAEEPGHYRIEAQQWVGSIVVPGATLLIRPKVSLDNLFLMLEVGEPEWREESFEWDTAAGLLPAFAAFFTRSVERTLSAGVFRAYRQEEDLIPALRGRLDLAAQFRRPGLSVPVPCRFEEFTADVTENRVLRAATRTLLRTPGVPGPVRRRLMHILSWLDEVADTFVDPGAVDRIHFTRLNERYRPSLTLAQLVLRNQTLLDQAPAGIGGVASSFLIDMNLLFQDFVTHRLRRHLRQRLEVLAEPKGHRLGHGGKIRLEPDLVFRRGSSDVFVADTKYKLLGDQLGRNSDYYQLLAYTTALKLPEGVLIYCNTDGGEPDKVVDVQNANKRLWTYRLDLSGKPDDVDASLALLADWIATHAGIPVTNAA